MAKRVKKVSTPRGNATSMVPVTPSPYYGQVRVSYGQSAGINRGDGADWMGPLNPLAPMAPTEVAGRRMDFQPGYNLASTPRSYEVVSFQTLRLMADSYDLMRLVIETRKDQVCKLKWKIRVKRGEGEKESPEATPDQQAAIDKITTLFRRPDGVNRWRRWLRELLEDRYVIDALTLYCQRNRGGELIALKPINGATIKVIIDDWGRTPTEPVNGIMPPAYQQSLKGFPAVNYTVRDMIYRPYNKRLHQVYGYSPVEQVIVTVNIAMRRQAFQLAYYTEGNVPEALIGTPDEWTPEQIKSFQTYWDAMFTGNLAARRHAKFVPGGVAKTYLPTKEPDLKNPMDDWLARIVCFAFSVSPQQLVAMMNRATAQTADTQSKEEGIEPDKDFIADMVDDIIEQEFARDDLEFAFEEEVEVDQEKQKDIITGYVEKGIKTINEGREMMGDEPLDDPNCDEPMVLTASGYMPIGANTIEGKQAAIDAGIVADPTAVPEPAPGAFNPGGKKPGAVKPKAGADKPKPGSVKPAKKHAPHAVLTPSMAKAARDARRSGRAGRYIPFDRPKVKAATASFAKTMHSALIKVSESAAALVREKLAKVAKAKKSKDIADEIADETDLSAIYDVIDDLAGDLELIAGDAAKLAMAQLGVDEDSDLVNQVFDRAVEQARQYAAELVGMRYDDNGDLVEAARSEYRIDESTRTMIRDIITEGLDDNIGRDEIASEIEDATAFSEERADLIAETEIRRANSMGALEGYKEASDAGVKVQKEWLTTDEACPICEENEAEGPIDLDDSFPSGDDSPPAHPNCRCAISPVTEDDEDANPDDTEVDTSDYEG